MKSFFTSCLLITLFLGLASSSLAESRSPYRVQFRGLSEVRDFIPSESFKRTEKAIKKPRISLRTYLPGLGGVKIQFNRERFFQHVPTMTDAAGEIRAVPLKTTLLKGRISLKNRTSAVAGSIYYVADKPYLFISFLGDNPRRGDRQLYKITVPLDSASEHVTGFVRRSNPAALKDFGCEAMGSSSFSEEESSKASSEIETANFSKAEASFRVVELNLDADSAFFGIFGSSSTSTMVTMVNDAETIYENDLSVTFDIVRQNTFTSTGFGTSDAGVKLDAYKDFTNVQGYAGNADAYMLFTGVNLDGGTIGIAYVGPVCISNPFSFGVTQYTDDPTTVVTFAHELGHLLDADHSTSGIMTASVTFPLATNFSSTSIAEINSHITNFGDACLDTIEGSDPDDPGGDDGGGGDGGGSDPPDFNLSIASGLTRSGSFSLTVTTDADLAGVCTLTVRAAPKKKKVNSERGKIIVSSLLSAATTNFAAEVSKKTEKFNDDDKTNKVFMKAFVVCESGDTGASNVSRIKPFRLKSKKVVRPGRWISHLKSRL